jgi:hypothetical protein
LQNSQREPILKRKIKKVHSVYYYSPEEGMHGVRGASVSFASKRCGLLFLQKSLIFFSTLLLLLASPESSRAQQNAKSEKIDHDLARKLEALFKDLLGSFKDGEKVAFSKVVMLMMIREGRAVSPSASERMYRDLVRIYWDGEALSQIPPGVQAASKQGAVNRSRSEVVLVNAPSGDYVFCLITKNQQDESWEYHNEGYALIRDVSRLLWQHFEPESKWSPAPEMQKWWKRIKRRRIPNHPGTLAIKSIEANQTLFSRLPNGLKSDQRTHSESVGRFSSIAENY